MILSILKKALHKQESLKRVTGGTDMNEIETLRTAHPRKILQTVVDKKISAILSYLSSGKWHVIKVALSSLGANSLYVEPLPEKKPRPINLQAEQPVGISLKYGYGKFIFDTNVIGFEPSPTSRSGGVIILAAPNRIEFVERRKYFRVSTPQSMKVCVVVWHRCYKEGNHFVPPERYWQGRLIDISAGGAQIVLDAAEQQHFRKGQFIGIQFTPMPYDKPLLFSAQIRNILPTTDEKHICLGLQVVGLEASPEGREVLARLIGVVERYYQMNKSGVKVEELMPAGLC